jgi:mediator of RNA polymerase II transcription subunit 31
MEESRRRFLLELEFVQCLANPQYLQCNFLIIPSYFNYFLVLSQHHLFKDQAFLNYLNYLKYWKQPEYVRYIVYI